MKKVLRHIFLLPVHFYQKIISPHLPSSCIYKPSCSNYFKHAVLKYGIARGFVAGSMRIGRCFGVFYTGGFDPLPEHFSFAELKKKYPEFRKKRQKKL
ncbi:MAG: membrane protein insertion efficiency factor YidD [Spirochaetales bacterium]|nr:membrane protein insertion efficiency factor YidD [Spirochaetales bacterium]